MEVVDFDVGWFSQQIVDILMEIDRLIVVEIEMVAGCGLFRGFLRLSYLLFVPRVCIGCCIELR